MYTLQKYRKKTRRKKLALFRAIFFPVVFSQRTPVTRPGTYVTSLRTAARASPAYAFLAQLKRAAHCSYHPLRAGMASEGSKGGETPGKSRRLGENVSMNVDSQSSPLLTPSPTAPMAPPTTATPAERLTRRWGAVKSLEDDTSGELFTAAIVQSMTTQTYTIYVDIVPTDAADKAPTDDREAKAMLVAFVEEHFQTDANASVLSERLKSGAIRSARLTGWEQADRIYMIEILLNMELTVQSTFMHKLFAVMGSDDDRSPLSSERRQNWPVITPAVQNPRYKFAAMILPSSRSPNLELTAFSAESPAKVRHDICTLLKVPNLSDFAKTPIAIYQRITSGVPLTEVVCWDSTSLPGLINGIAHLGTPQFLIQSEACYEFIRKLGIERAHLNAALSSREGANSGSSDSNPAFTKGDQTGVNPKPILRTPITAPGQVGPPHSLSFRYATGSVAAVITHVALLLSAFFSSTAAPTTSPEAGTTQYWVNRILARTRFGKPVRFVVAAPWGPLFAGVYQALQGAILHRIDSCTRIVLSAALCLCSRCLGGSMCHKCGKAGHLFHECTQDIRTPYKDITYRCPFCRKLGGIALGHEWDICKDCGPILMGRPDSNCCGICGHPEHSTPQCPSIRGPQGVILLEKMSSELVQNGWALDTSSNTVSAAIDTAVQPATPSPTQPPRHPWRTTGPSPSVSSTESTVSLPLTGSGDQVAVANANAEVYELVRNAMRGELVPIQTQLGKLSSAVEKQGGNIDGLAEMLEEFGTRLETVEATGEAINQRIARMRAKFQHQQQLRSNARPVTATDQMSEHSQEDNFQDATLSLQDTEMYDPTIPSDFTDGAPMQPGLESPAPVMPI